MAKDPAVLFYSSDFLSGTMTMSFEDRGKYITILCAMHQKGRLSEEQIVFIVGPVSPPLKSKFFIDENGLWFNVRLEEEIENRKRWTNSRRNNRKGHKNKSHEKDMKNISESYDTTYQNHMSSHMENENGNIRTNEIKGDRGLGKGDEFIPQPGTLIGDMRETWKRQNPESFIDEHENASLFSIGKKIVRWRGLKGSPEKDVNIEIVKSFWNRIVSHCCADPHLSKYSIAQIEKLFSSVTKNINSNGTNKQRDSANLKTIGGANLAASLEDDYRAATGGKSNFGG